jgi:hypothetical protein
MSVEGAAKFGWRGDSFISRAHSPLVSRYYDRYGDLQLEERVTAAAGPPGRGGLR